MTESSYNLEEQVQILSLTTCIVQFLLTTELVVDQTVNDLGSLLLPSKTNTERTAIMSKLSYS